MGGPVVVGRTFLGGSGGMPPPRNFEPSERSWCLWYYRQILSKKTGATASMLTFHLNLIGRNIGGGGGGGEGGS